MGLVSCLRYRALNGTEGGCPINDPRALRLFQMLEKAAVTCQSREEGLHDRSVLRFGRRGVG